jgi:hypothetical protein
VRAADHKGDLMDPLRAGIALVAIARVVTGRVATVQAAVIGEIAAIVAATIVDALKVPRRLSSKS